MRVAAVLAATLLVMLDSGPAFAQAVDRS